MSSALFSGSRSQGWQIRGSPSPGFAGHGGMGTKPLAAGLNDRGSLRSSEEFSTRAPWTATWAPQRRPARRQAIGTHPAPAAGGSKPEKLRMGVCGGGRQALQLQHEPAPPARTAGGR